MTAQLTPLVLVSLALAGGVGAVLRAIADATIAPRHSLPLGLFLVNLTGAFLVGLAAAASTLLAPEIVLVITVGFCGGYTTFSTASLRAAQDLAAKRWWPALTTAVAQAVAAVGLTALGLAVASLLLGFSG